MSRGGGLAPRLTLEQLRKIRPELAAELEAGPAAAPAKAAGRPWSAAKTTQVVWLDGEVVTLPSRTEARVARRLLAEAAAIPGARLYRQVRVPLLSIGSRERGLPLYLTVDFVLVHPDGREEWIDAKSRRVSREWLRGRKAAEAWLGERIVEADL